MRIAAVIEYDGSRFCGWQLQLGQRTVQAVVEAAFSQVAAHPVRVTAAGRTDTAVHALGQVIHFDTDASRSSKGWTRGANRYLPRDVAVSWAGIVADEFHARFCAMERHYRYLILNRPERPALWTGKVGWDYRPLDVALMAQGAAFLLGEHDFSAFRGSQCQAKSPVRHLRELTVAREGSLVVIDAAANGFLHHMVRNLVGVLADIGAGERPPEWARDVLAQRDRTLAGMTVSPEGLYLHHVDYPRKYGVPVNPAALMLSAGSPGPAGSRA